MIHYSPGDMVMKKSDVRNAIWIVGMFLLVCLYWASTPFEILSLFVVSMALFVFVFLLGLEDNHE